MFSSLKTKFHIVQEGLTSSLQSLNIASNNSSTLAVSSKPNFDAGAELLHKYQTEWNDLHKNAIDNALQAEIVSRIIAKLCLSVKKQHNDVERFNSCMESLPSLIQDLNVMFTQIENINKLVVDVENDLIKLDDSKNAHSMHVKMHQERIELARYEEKRLAQLENLRVMLAQEYSMKLAHYEQTQSAKLKERQEIFNEAFQKDIEQYKESGILPPTSSHNKKEVSLEEIELDPVTDGLNDLLKDYQE